MARKHERTKARASAVAILYSSDIVNEDVAAIVAEGRYPSEDFEFPQYAEDLVCGVADHLDEIDDKLSAVSENWALDRMPVVDRAILRLAVYEMLYVDDVPVSVTINEAVELAKSYGGEDDSSRFVNGVLGRIARQLEGVDADELAEIDSANEACDEPADEAVDVVEPEAASDKADQD